MEPKLHLADMYGRQNRECAEIILADIQRYSGDKSLMGRWARRVLNGPAERTASRRPA